VYLFLCELLFWIQLQSLKQAIILCFQSDLLRQLVLRDTTGL
jgi:hypothetical protein